MHFWWPDDGSLALGTFSCVLCLRSQYCFSICLLTQWLCTALSLPPTRAVYRSLDNSTIKQTLVVYAAFEVSVFFFKYAFLMSSLSMPRPSVAAVLTSRRSAVSLPLTPAWHGQYINVKRDFCEFCSLSAHSWRIYWLSVFLSILCESVRIVACGACCFASHVTVRVATSTSILMLKIVIANV